MENPKRLKGEEMRWVGWKQVKIIIPDTIQQENYKVTEERGITFLAFEIYFAPEDIYLCILITLLQMLICSAKRIRILTI